MSDRISRKDIEEMKRRAILANTLLRPPAVAALLQVSVRTVYRLDDEGLIQSQPLRPGQTLGRRYSLLSIEEYRQRVLGDEYQPIEEPARYGG